MRSVSDVAARVNRDRNGGQPPRLRHSGPTGNDPVADIEWRSYDPVMDTRYTLLRESVANLAASADDQASYLDNSFAGLTGGKSAEAYGNDELAMEFDDSFVAVGHMLEYGEICQSEIDALRSLDEMLNKWSGPRHKDFWARKALFEDPRWEEIRLRASEVLALLPDEARESEYTRSLANGNNGS